jgi:galactonate dehydratase
MAKQLAQLLEPHRPLFIEEPLLPGHVNELKDLYNKTTIPIAVSTRIVSPTQADLSARRAIVHTS